MSNASAVEAVLFAALEKPTAAERNAFLDSACAGDAELRRQVERLLKAHANVGDFLQKPVGEQLAAAPEPADATQEIASTDGPRAGPAGRTGLYLARTEGAGASDEGVPLAFLQPSTRPDSLGRLGHYEILQILGQGGFGIVFRAFDEQLQRVVAIKVLAPEMAATSPPRKRFLREARSSAKVKHENVVQIYTVEEEPLPYLVMEFVPGETLQQRLDRIGPLEVAEVVRLGRQIAAGLAAAHDQGLIHRDIKPGNILLEAGPHPHAKITDFGLARAADDASLTQSGVVAGTPMYMAPEQASADTFDHRADLFSLGSVLYVMCSGRPPFRAPSTLAVLKRVVEDTPRPIREIVAEVPAWLCNLIAKLHAKMPDDRLATAREVADLLGRGLAALQHPRSAKPPSVAAPAVPKTPPSQETSEAAPTIKPRFSGRRWLVAAAMLLVLLGGFSLTEATGVTNVRGTVIRLFSPEGTLVVEVDDPGVSVKIDGAELVITGAGAKEIRLKPGSYTVEARKDGKLVSQELVAVTNNGRQVVRVSQEAATVPETAAEKKDPDRRAAEYVLSIGGQVQVNGEGPVINAAADLPRKAFQLTYFSLHLNKQVTDAGLAAFKDCKNLTRLILSCTAVGDAGLAHFKDCKALMELELRDTQVTDAGLANFKECKNLTAFALCRCAGISDAGLAHLKDCKGLKAFSLDGTHVTDAGLAHLGGCKGLTHLIAPGLPITGEGLAPFKDCKDLTDVNLNETKVSDAGLEHLKDCKKLVRLGLQETPITDAGLAHLAGLNRLTELNLCGTKVSDAGLAHLKGMPLRVLVVFNTGITDLTPLQGMPLEDILLTPKNISRGLETLRDRKSLKTIGIAWNQTWPPAEFWERYRKGEFKE